MATWKWGLWINRGSHTYELTAVITAYARYTSSSQTKSSKGEGRRKVHSLAEEIWTIGSFWEREIQF